MMLVHTRRCNPSLGDAARQGSEQSVLLVAVMINAF